MQTHTHTHTHTHSLTCTHTRMHTHTHFVSVIHYGLACLFLFQSTILYQRGKPPPAALFVCVCLCDVVCGLHNHCVRLRSFFVVVLFDSGSSVSRTTHLHINPKLMFLMKAGGTNKQYFVPLQASSPQRALLQRGPLPTFTILHLADFTSPAVRLRDRVSVRRKERKKEKKM